MVSVADNQVKPCLSMAFPSLRPAPKRLSWSLQQTLKRVELQWFRRRGRARRGRSAFMQPGSFVP